MCLVDGNGGTHAIPARSFVLTLDAHSERIRAVIDIAVDEVDLDGVVDVTLRDAIDVDDLDERLESEGD